MACGTLLTEPNCHLAATTSNLLCPCGVIDRTVPLLLPQEITQALLDLLCRVLRLLRGV